MGLLLSSVLYSITLILCIKLCNAYLLPEIPQRALCVYICCLCMAQNFHSCQESVQSTPSASELAANCYVLHIYSRQKATVSAFVRHSGTYLFHTARRNLVGMVRQMSAINGLVTFSINNESLLHHDQIHNCSHSFPHKISPKYQDSV